MGLFRRQREVQTSVPSTITPGKPSTFHSAASQSGIIL
jgi:hypothetical protein